MSYSGFCCSMDHKVKIRESAKIDKYLNLPKEPKKLWNRTMMVIPIVVGALGQRRNRDNPGHKTIEIGSNTYKSPGNLRLAVTQTPMEKKALLKTSIKYTHEVK